MQTGRHPIRSLLTLFAVVAAVMAFVPGPAHADQDASRAATLTVSPGQLVTIDAETNPDDAIAALKLYENATDRSFTPSGDPVFGQSKWQPVTDLDGDPAPSVTGNAKTDQAVTERLTIKHEESSSWSLGGSIETAVGFKLAGIVDTELSVKVTANHTWESSVVDTQGIWVTANPGKTVWIEASTGTATLTGTFTFASGGARYVVKNVAITQPAAPDADASAATSYRVMEADSTDLGVAADTKGGLMSIRKVPKLGAYIRQGH